MFLITKIKRKLQHKYNLLIRPFFGHDLNILYRASNEDYPFGACSSDIHLMNALLWLDTVNKKLAGQGFPAKFSVGSSYGMTNSYPETTGYTLSTLLTIFRNQPWKNFNYNIVKDLIENCHNYLLTMQLENGAFTGGREGQAGFGEPSVFDTGQILLGLSDLYEASESKTLDKKISIDRPKLKIVIVRAADFLLSQIDNDGAFKPAHTYLKTKKTYYTRAAYGLLRSGIVLNNEKYKRRARRNFDYALSQQETSGWINGAGFNDNLLVLHTIAYTLRGLVEAATYFKEKTYLQAVAKNFDFLLDFNRENFRYPKLLPSHYAADKTYFNDLCITGLSQIAIVIKKYNAILPTPDNRLEKLFSEIVQATKRFQIRGMKNPCLNGAMPASWPINGKYQPYNLIEWGVKFFMDSLLLDMGISSGEIKG